jgi:hypothetical protein
VGPSATRSLVVLADVVFDLVLELNDHLCIL